MAKQRRGAHDVYQLKVVLRGSKPPIWRRFVVPSDVRMDELHEVIQVVMGWTDSHLHHFLIDGKYYEAKSRDGVDLGNEGRDECAFRLEDLVKTEKTQFVYEYDFGDSWEHLLTLEKILPADAESESLLCLKGKGACPPEDCGGIWGYYQMLEVLADPEHEEHEDVVEWLGGEFDPAAFDLEEINKVLKSFQVP